MEFGANALQLSGVLSAVLVGIKWLEWNGFYHYFGLTPEEAGITNTSLVFEGLIQFVPFGVALALLIMAELHRLRSRDLWYPATLAAIVAVVILSYAVGLYRELPVGGRQLYDYLFSTLSALLVVVLLAAGAAAIVRRSRLSVKVAVGGLVASMVVGLPLAYLTGVAYAGDLVSTRAGAYIAGFANLPGRTFVSVRPQGPDDIPDSCGILLGTSNGSFLIWLNARPSVIFAETPGLTRVWRLPTDTTVLSSCQFREDGS